MATHITIEIELDDEHVDPADGTGMTEEAYEQFVDAINSFGSIVSGPTGRTV